MDLFHLKGILRTENFIFLIKEYWIIIFRQLMIVSANVTCALIG